MKIIVLGGGRVGGAMARDLALDSAFNVTVADVAEDLATRFGDVPRIATHQANLGDAAALAGAIAGHDLVVGAVPGFMGFETVRRVLDAGKPIVDISFFPEDAFALDSLAKEKGLVAIVDCGVAPGCSNLILGRMLDELARVDRFLCYVGGLPTVRTWPYEYKAVFSPIDVIEEYTRPARLVEYGQVAVYPALTGLELLDLPGVGTVEAFNSDGLRSLVHTCREVPFMAEKTLRFPGHAERMRMLRDTGFFSQEPVQVGGVRIRPIDLTARLMFPLWKLEPGEEDFTVMRIVVEGRAHGGAGVRHTFDLLDRYDRATGTTSMARTTGYTATAAVRAVAAGLWQRPGIAPPELLGREAAVHAFILTQLAQRGVHFTETVTQL
jgi:saccharopine dehydrogenase-like NADP-dependent oxidoreductase